MNKKETIIIVGNRLGETKVTHHQGLKTARIPKGLLDFVELNKGDILKGFLALDENSDKIFVFKFSRVGAKPDENTNFKRRAQIPARLRHEVFKRDGYRCLECGATNNETRLQADHIIPVSRGGSDELDNLQTLCKECNLAKRDRTWKGGEIDERGIVDE
jgi:hypothetical protein